jgi:hypothetical protein
MYFYSLIYFPVSIVKKCLQEPKVTFQSSLNIIKTEVVNYLHFLFYIFTMGDIPKFCLLSLSKDKQN